MFWCVPQVQETAGWCFVLIMELYDPGVSAYYSSKALCSLSSLAQCPGSGWYLQSYSVEITVKILTPGFFFLSLCQACISEGRVLRGRLKVSRVGSCLERGLPQKPLVHPLAHFSAAVYWLQLCEPMSYICSALRLKGFLWVVHVIKYKQSSQPGAQCPKKSLANLIVFSLFPLSIFIHPRASEV